MQTEISNRVKSLRDTAFRYQGCMDALISRQAELFFDMKEAQDYLDNRETTLSTLEKIQDKAQARDKVVFENILTSLIREVLPNKADKVLFTTGTSNNKTTLDIELDVDGNIENVAEKGGSVKNIVSVGLRCIALSQTHNRWFLAFDESDCWLKTHHIPQFAQILSELSAKLGIQMIYVSHHEPSAFTGKARIIELNKEASCDGDIIVPDIISDVENVIDGGENAAFSEGMGFNAVRLVNFKSHTNTKFDLSERVTVITGDVDLGKSTLIEAIRCVQENDCSNRIRHHQDSARVEITIEEDMTIVWEIEKPKRKTKDGEKAPGIGKATYSLYDADGEEIYPPQSFKKGTLPTWLHEYLAMAPVNGIEQMHIATQEFPNFLIDSKTTAQRRSEILSLNQQSSLIHKMIELHGQKTRNYVKQLNTQQKELVAIKLEMDSIRPICNIIEKIHEMEHLIAELNCENELNTKLEKFIDKISILNDRHSKLDAILSKIKTQPCSVNLIETNHISSRFNKIELFAETCNYLNVLTKKIKVPTLPELEDVKTILMLGKKLTRFQDASMQIAMVDSVIMPVLPGLLDVRTLLTKAKRLTSATRLSEMLSYVPSVMPSQPNLADTQKENEKIEQTNLLLSLHKKTTIELIAERIKQDVAKNMRHNISDALGHECPLCGGEMKFENDYDNSN